MSTGSTFKDLQFSFWTCLLLGRQMVTDWILCNIPHSLFHVLPRLHNKIKHHLTDTMCCTHIQYENEMTNNVVQYYCITLLTVSGHLNSYCNKWNSYESVWRNISNISGHHWVWTTDRKLRVQLQMQNTKYWCIMQVHTTHYRKTVVQA